MDSELEELLQEEHIDSYSKDTEMKLAALIQELREEAEKVVSQKQQDQTSTTQVHIEIEQDESEHFGPELNPDFNVMENDMYLDSP